MVGKIAKAWEERSKKYLDKPEGVLPKAFPVAVNKYLDDWMYAQIKFEISDPKSHILDLGCGYGRLAGRLLADFGEAKVSGIDIARSYVAIFNKSLGPRGRAVVGDITRLPYKNDSFDVCYMVTTLMYLTKRADQVRALKEIFRVLKPGGRFVFIERNPSGHAFVNLFGLVPLIRGRSKKEIDSTSFSPRCMKELIGLSGGKIVTKYGLPVWTLTLHINIVLNKLGLLRKGYLMLIKLLDRFFAHLLTFSMYVSYSGKKK